MKRKILIGISLLIFGGIVFGLYFNSDVAAGLKNQLYGDDPDVPDFAKHKVDREEFLMRRSEDIARRRGVEKDKPFDPQLRINAIEQMERQEEELRQSFAPQAPWVQLGPAPIPNGQTTTNSVPVSGRTISIAVHPTNPNTVYVGTAQGGLYRSINGGANWTPLMDNAASLVIGALAIAPSQPETLYVGTGEPTSSGGYSGVGIYRISNASTAATLSGPFGAAAFAGNAVSEILVHPTNPAIIFASSTSGVGGLRAVAASGPPRGVYRSTNATSGAPTFAKVFFSDNLSVRDMAMDPTNANVIVMSVIAEFGIGGLYQSADALSAAPTITGVLGFNCSSDSDCVAELASQKSGGAADATFYVATGDLGGSIARSTDGGESWTFQIDNDFCGGQCFYNIAIAVDPTNPNNVYLGGQAATQGLISARSTNGAFSFTTVNDNLHADTHVITVAPSNPTIIYMGNDGGIFKSTNSGVSWASLNNTQFHATQFIGIDVHPTDPNFTIGGTQDNGTNFFRPNATWFRIDFGDGGYAAIDQNTASTTNVRMYHTFFNAAGLQGYGTVSTTAASFDGNWTFRGCNVANATVNGITCNGAVNFYAPLERGPGNPNTIYYGSDRLYRSADNGLNHTVVSQNPIVPNVPLSAIGISPQNDNVRVVGLNNGAIFGTSTGAATLANLDAGNAVPNSPINRVVIAPNNSNTAYVTLSGFNLPANVWRTTNLSSGAPTWTPISNGVPAVPVNAFVVDPANPMHLYAGTDIGVYNSVDGGATWTVLGTGLPRVAVFDMAITPGATPQVRIATHGRGLWQHPTVNPTAAAVSVSGRVTGEDGKGVSRAFVKITDASGDSRQAVTNAFGYYRFNEVRAGETYTFDISAKRYAFPPQIVTINEETENLNFAANGG